MISFKDIEAAREAHRRALSTIRPAPLHPPERNHRAWKFSASSTTYSAPEVSRNAEHATHLANSGGTTEAWRHRGLGRQSRSGTRLPRQNSWHSGDGRDAEVCAVGQSQQLPKTRRDRCPAWKRFRRSQSPRPRNREGKRAWPTSTAMTTRQSSPARERWVSKLSSKFRIWMLLSFRSAAAVCSLAFLWRSRRCDQKPRLSPLKRTTSRVFAAALEAGKPTKIAMHPTLADGLAIPQVGTNAFEDR